METNMGLEKLLYLQGVGAEYIDCHGHHVQIAPSDRTGILASMLAKANVNTEPLNPVDPTSSLALTDPTITASTIADKTFSLDVAPWLSLLPSFQFCHLTHPVILIYLPEQAAEIAFSLTLEEGAVTPSGQTEFEWLCHTQNLAIIGEYHHNNIRYCRYQVNLIDYISETLPLGYHQVFAQNLSHNSAVSELESASGTLMIAPKTCYQGVMMDNSLSPVKPTNGKEIAEHSQFGNAKLWGISIQLYSLKSSNDPLDGIGDFKALKQLIEFSAQQGADFVMLNPLHALDIANAEHCSPYSPSDRRRLNPLYINIDELLDSNASRIEHSELDVNLNHIKLINYKRVFEYKYKVFVKSYELFCLEKQANSTARYKAFNAFKAQQGHALSAFCQDQMKHAPEWLSMPADFYAYLQFVAVEQLTDCQQYCLSLGMKIGLIGDLAIGAILQGNEVQSQIEQFCTHASIGAPADRFSPSGQNWGLTPLDPIKLKQHNYRHFIDLMRSNMQFYGALRIDHVMGLLRLWWWPLSKTLGNGAYVYYPLDTLLAIVCLESQRAKCMVIGEDLGIVPPEISAAMQQSQLLSNQLFYFSQHHDGFIAPQQHKLHSLMMLANHDVAPLKGWWQGEDLHIRDRLALYPQPQQYQDELKLREKERYQLLQWIDSGLTTLLKTDLTIPSELNELAGQIATLFASNTDNALSMLKLDDLSFDLLLDAWLMVAATSQSSLFCVQLSDLLADKHCINIPGTWKSFPNWQRRLSKSIDHVKQDKQVSQRCQLIAAARHQAACLKKDC